LLLAPLPTKQPEVLTAPLNVPDRQPQITAETTPTPHPSASAKNNRCPSGSVFDPDDQSCDPISSIFVPDSAPSGVGIQIGSPDADVIRASDTRDVVSLIVDVTLVDGSQNIGGKVEICIEASDPRTNRDDVCLGFLDTTQNRWKCEDSCLQDRDGLYCGSTRHFTNFALLLEGKSNSEDGCGEAEQDFILGSWWKDLILAASCALFMCCCGVLVVAAVIWIAPVRRCMYGKEGNRIASLRASMHNTGTQRELVL
jgi:hypothetical protein